MNTQAQWITISHNNDINLSTMGRMYYIDLLLQESEDYYNETYGEGNWNFTITDELPEDFDYKIYTVINGELAKAPQDLMDKRLAVLLKLDIDSKIKEIKQYDTSDAVNMFNINGIDLWLGKNDRVSLEYLIKVSKLAGETNISLWNNGIEFELNIDDAELMLAKLEIYAKKSFDTTQRHINAVSVLKTKEEVESYDFTVNYPEKLVF